MPKFACYHLAGTGQECVPVGSFLCQMTFLINRMEMIVFSISVTLRLNVLLFVIFRRETINFLKYTSNDMTQHDTKYCL